MLNGANLEVSVDVTITASLSLSLRNLDSKQKCEPFGNISLTFLICFLFVCRFGTSLRHDELIHWIKNLQCQQSEVGYRSESLFALMFWIKSKLKHQTWTSRMGDIFQLFHQGSERKEKMPGSGLFWAGIKVEQLVPPKEGCYVRRLVPTLPTLKSHKTAN